MVAINQLQELSGGTYGVTLPKDDLRVEGILNEEGDLVDEQQLVIQKTGEGEWTLKLADNVLRDRTATTVD